MNDIINEWPPNLMVFLVVPGVFEKFPCLLCKKTFSRAGSLKKYKLVHTGEKPHQRTSCEKTFSRASNLRTHQLPTLMRSLIIVQCVQNHSPKQVA